MQEIGFGSGNLFGPSLKYVRKKLEARSLSCLECIRNCFILSTVTERIE
jgi:hypothetical protein